MAPRHHTTEATNDSHLRRVLEWMRGQVWLIPAVFVVAAFGLAWAMALVDRDLDTDAGPGFVFRGTIADGQAMLMTIAAAMLTFMGVVFSISIVTLQLASSQFSPRVLRSFLRNPGTQVVLGVFSATFFYALVALGTLRLDDPTGDGIEVRLSVAVAFTLVATSLGAFVYYVHHISQSIRVVSIIESVARDTRRAIADTYPRTPQPAAPAAPVTPPDMVVTLDEPGVVAAVEIETLVRLAAHHDCFIAITSCVGRYLARGIPVAEVHGSTAIRPDQILAALDVQTERTMYQDPAFGFRQLVDIAERALSPAVNDPTTAVQTIDRLDDLLRDLAGRPDATGVHLDGDGHPRLALPVMAWESFVELAFDEIRDCGAGQIQVARRMRASIDSLLETVPPHRRPPLELQRRFLDRAVGRSFADPDERAEAREPDPIGLGGR